MIEYFKDCAGSPEEERNDCTVRALAISTGMPYHDCYMYLANFGHNMKLEDIKQLVLNKINALQNDKNLAYMNGNMDRFYLLEEEIKEAEIILEKLNS